jgi:glycyl-tRNA synthetase beta chain
MSQLLFELFSEEIPARMQRRAADDLKRLAAEALKDANLSFEDMHCYATPRRLALVIDGLPEAQPDVKEEKRGPRTDAPQKAIDGFLRANGIAIDACEKRVAGKGEFWFAVIEQAGRPTHDVLAHILPDLLHKLPWQKSMRWGENSFRWVRPLQRVMCVYDGELLTIATPDGIPCGNVTSGHRFLSPNIFEVGYFGDYEKTLQLNKVILRGKTRRDLIEQTAAQLAEEAGFTVKRDAALLAEVGGLVEWPVVMMGKIDAVFMELPEEVLVTSMRAHQKYFAVEDKDGKLAPRFIVVANMEAEDGGAAIIAGNERVLRARLSDAIFFWDKDRKQKLEAGLMPLRNMVFHEKLGSLADKVSRLEALAIEIADYIPDADAASVRQAAMLCKADLTTGMVGEFPELQGIMGRYYAKGEGVDDAVADAIAGHYAPAGPDDVCPSAPVTLAVSLADKIDTLVGFFGIDEKPTGSRDPYALRRAALGVIRMILENELRVPLADILAKAVSHYDASLAPTEKIVAELLAFFADRLKVHLRGQGVRHDFVSAVFAVHKPDGAVEDDLVRLIARIDALQAFLATDDGKNLLAAHKRAANIVGIEEKKDKSDYSGAPTGSLLTDADEKALFDRLEALSGELRPIIEGERFNDAMTALAGLRGPVDAFFDNVTVNVEDADIRTNRLRLLSQISRTMGEVAAFGEVEG